MSFLKNNLWVLNIILFLVASSSCFVIGEIFIRFLENSAYQNGLASYQAAKYKMIYSDDRDKPYVFAHKPNINVQLDKGSFNFTIITNSEGLREEKDYFNLNKSIIFLGDSIIEGASVENNETIDEVFEKNTGFNSLNFGVGSYSTVHQYHFLKSKYNTNYNTKLIVLGFCLNDFKQNILLRYFDPEDGNWKLYKYLNNKLERVSKMEKIKNFLRKSKLLVFINSSVKSLILNDNTEKKINKTTGEINLIPSYNADLVSDEEIYFTSLYLNKIKEFSNDINSKFVVIIFPTDSQLEKDFDINNQSQKILKKILEENKIEFIDLYPELKKKYKENSKIIWYHDDIHPNKKGHKLIGEYLSIKLPEMFPSIFYE